MHLSSVPYDTGKNAADRFTVMQFVTGIVNGMHCGNSKVNANVNQV
jgi:hypothetical protein